MSASVRRSIIYFANILNQKKVKIIKELFYTTILHLGIYPQIIKNRYSHKYTAASKVETTQMSIIRQMGKQDVVESHDGI